ncbi:uncharacterized protein LOC104443927 isoform X29 [Eucalyptus grandis]|uniref:uncharacterized protein LOC104443927 isoform X29 n=1 Tax=Eucalyptus grandis TaxID=71139 RepID=UPI00192EFFDC|nr:uncharacterized protein LOC104443927 isoform X29 [Eucalyptus grandis]
MLAGPHTKADAASNKHRSWKSPPASPQASICCVGIISRSDGLLLRDRSRDGGAVGEMQAKNPREATIRQGKCTERNGELRSSQGRRWQERRGKKNEDQVASQKLVVKMDIGDEEAKTKAKRVVWHIAGFERLTVDTELNKLTVSGTMDPVKVVNKLTKLHAEMVSFGAAKEDDGKKEGGKKNEDQVASQKLVVKVDLGDEEDRTKAKRVVWHIAGFERLTVDKKHSKLTVSGTMDPVKVVNKLTKLHAEMVSFGAAKEDDGKKEGGKKNEDQVASQLVVKVDLGDEEDRTKAKRVVWHIAGFERLTVDKKHSKLTVSGTIDPVKVVNKLTKLHAEMVSFGAAKEDDGKKEGGKKNEDQVASQKLVVKMDIGDEEAKTKAKRVVWHIAGFERLTVDTELNKLTVSGTMDPVKVVNKLTKLHAEMVSFGAAKEDDGKKEGGKKNEDQVASQKLVVKVDKGDEEDRTKAKRVVWHIAGFERLTVDTKLNKLTASGTMDPVKVVNKLTKLHAEMMSFGAAKEDDGKKEGGKKNEDQVASQKLVVKVDIGDEEDRTKGKRVVWHVAGFERLTVDTELNKLTVSGTMDPVKVVNKLTKLHAEMVIFGAAKEDDGKKEGGKKNEDQVASQKLVVKVDLGDEEDRTKAKRVVWHIAGFERLTVDTELNKLTVSGTMDPVKVVNKLTKLHAEMVSFGAAKEDDGKKEGGKKNEDQVASQKLVVKVDLGNEEDKIRAEQVVQCIAGFERLAVDTTHTKLTVSGTLDPVEVVNKLRKSLHAEMVSCGAAKEDGGKKEGGKKNEDQVTSQKLVVKVDLRDEKDRKVFRKDAWKEVNRIAGFDYLAMDTKDNKLTVSGIMDPVEVVNELRESWDTEIVSFGTAKEDDGKKEEGKKNGVLVANRVKASQRRSGRQSCRVEFLE